MPRTHVLTQRSWYPGGPTHEEVVCGRGREDVTLAAPGTEPTCGSCRRLLGLAKMETECPSCARLRADLAARDAECARLRDEIAALNLGPQPDGSVRRVTVWRRKQAPPIVIWDDDLDTAIEDAADRAARE